MNKIVEIVLIFSLTICVALAFVGCSEKERTKADIDALLQTMQKDYAVYFDNDGEIKVDYDTSIQNLINEESSAKLLNDYFAKIAKASYSFYNLTKTSVSDEWAKEDRIKIYKNLSSVNTAFKNFNESKSRFELAFNGYTDGAISNIQQSHYQNYVKEYASLIKSLQKFQSTFIKAYYNNMDKDFYKYDGTKEVKAQQLQITLKDKAFDIAKMSINLEYANYFDLSKMAFYEKVASANTTKLCLEMEKVTALESKASADLTTTQKKNAYKLINNNESIFETQMTILNDSIKSFNYSKMRKSNDTESAYVEKQSYATQAVYNGIMYLAFDYIPQIVKDYQTTFNSF